MSLKTAKALVVGICLLTQISGVSGKELETDYLIDVLKEFARTNALNAQFDPCLQEKVANKSEYKIDDGFLKRVYYTDQVTHVIDGDKVFFSCKEMLRERKVKDLQQFDSLFDIAFPVFSQKSIFGGNTIAMPEAAWSLMGRLSGAEPAGAVSDSKSNQSVVYVYQFKNRLMSEQDTESVLKSVQELERESIFYDKVNNTIVGSLLNQETKKILDDLLTALDREQPGATVTLVSFKTNEKAILDYLLSAQENIKDVTDGLVCTGNRCNLEDIEELSRNVEAKKLGGFEKLMSLQSKGLDVIKTETSVDTVENAVFYARDGSSNYLINDVNLYGRDEETINDERYTTVIDTGFYIDGRYKRISGERILMEYNIVDGDSELTENEKLVSSSEIAFSNRVNMLNSKYKLIKSRKYQEKRREVEVFPILGYIPLIGALFNETVEQSSTYFKFYFLKVEYNG